MTARSIPVDLPPRCWSSIGVGGDRSCPELAEYTHCRNCPVFTLAGRQLMERPAPPGYLAEWTEFLADARLRTTTRSLSTLVFRISAEWLAVDAGIVGEVAAARPAHRIAHRTSGVLVGLVNIRGQLLLQVSLHKLLHLETPTTLKPQPRLVVIHKGGASWVFQADEILGVQRFAATDVSPVPVTVAQGMARVSRGLISLGARNVGFVDSDQLFGLLRQAVG
jgi:chemotaxis-related protein WspD